MSQKPDFEILDFLPYLMAQAADTLSIEFQHYYKSRFGMLRTEWRVLFHLGSYGDMTARDICARAGLHKTKVSRAVAALEKKRFLCREELESDRRAAMLSLTRSGKSAFADLREAARTYDAKIRANMTPEESKVLRSWLVRVAGIETRNAPSAH